MKKTCDYCDKPAAVRCRVWKGRFIARLTKPWCFACSDHVPVMMREARTEITLLLGAEA